VSQALCIIAGEYELDCCEERLAEFFLLVRDVLADTQTDIAYTALEFQYASCNSVDVQDDIRPFVVLTFDCYLLSNIKLVVLRILPVDVMDRLILVADVNLDRCAKSE